MIKNKVMGLMKNELGGRIVKEFVALIPMMFNYLTNDSCVNKKAKGKNKIYNKTLNEICRK